MMTPDAAAKKAKLEAILERLRSNRDRLSIVDGKPLVRSEEDAVTSELYRTSAPAVAHAPAPAAAAPVAAPAPPPRLKPLPPRPASAPVAAPPGGLASSFSRPAPAPEPEPEESVTWEGEDEEEMEVSEVRDVDAPAELADEEPLAVTVPHSRDVAPPPPPPLPSTTVSPSAAAVAAAAPLRPGVVASAFGAAAHGEETSPQAIRVEAPTPIEAPVIRTLGTVEAQRPRSIGVLLRGALRMFE
jgi:hypothetical protein